MSALGGLLAIAVLAGWSVLFGTGQAQGADPASGLERQALPKWLQVPKISEVRTKGNTEEKPAWYTDVKITPDQVQKIRARRFKAAFLNWDDSVYNQSIVRGAKDAFDALGIDLVAVTNHRFNSAKLQQDVQTVVALDPNIIMYGGVNPVSDVAAMRPAVEAGAVVVAYANAPRLWKRGDPTNFVALISYDTHGMGEAVADAVARKFPGGAKVGIIYFDADYRLVHEREQGFADGLKKYPNLQVVTRSPMTDPYKTQPIASAMIARYPDLNVIFAPWDTPAEGVVAALRGAGRADVAVASIDLGYTGAREMACGGQIFVEGSNLMNEWGRTGAIAAALQLVGESVPPYIIVPSFAVTKENLVEGWALAYGPKIPLPREAHKCLGR